MKLLKKKEMERINVANPCHQVTWTQKQDKKEKARVNFLFSKSPNLNIY